MTNMAKPKKTEARLKYRMSNSAILINAFRNRFIRISTPLIKKTSRRLLFGVPPGQRPRNASLVIVSMSLSGIHFRNRRDAVRQSPINTGGPRIPISVQSCWAEWRIQCVANYDDATRQRLANSTMWTATAWNPFKNQRLHPAPAPSLPNRLCVTVDFIVRIKGQKQRKTSLSGGQPILPPCHGALPCVPCLCGFSSA